MAFLAIQSVMARASLLLSQMALGYLLMPADFGISGVAQMITTVAWTVIGFGIDSVYQQRNKKMHVWEKSAFYATLGQGFVAAIFLIMLAPFLSGVFHSSKLMVPILIVGFSMPIIASSVVSGAKIGSNLQFRWLATYNFLETSLLQLLIVILAYLKMGPYSFFIPIPIVYSIRAICFTVKAPVNLSGRATLKQVIILINKGYYIFSTKLLNSLVDQGDYFVLGLMSNPTAVGYYLFAFRLAAMPVRIIALNLQNILFSALSKIGSSVSKKKQAALRAAEILSYVVTPLCLVQVVVAEPLLNLLFGDKWRPSVILIQILCLGLPGEAIASVARAHLNASGAFRQSVAFHLVSAAVFFVLVLIGAVWGAAEGTALAVSLFYGVAQTAFFLILLSDKSSWLQTLRKVFLTPLLLSAAATIVGQLMTYVGAPLKSPIFDVLAIGGVSGLSYLGLVWFFQRVLWTEIQALVEGIISRNIARRGSSSAL